MTWLGYVVRLVQLASFATLTAMGTSVLGLLFTIGSAFIPAYTAWKISNKSRRAVRSVWRNSIRPGLIGLLVVWSVVFLCELILIQPENLSIITVHQLYKDDFPQASIGLSDTITNQKTGEKTNVESKVVLDFPSNSKFIVVYIPLMGAERAFMVCKVFSQRFQQIFDGSSNVQMAMGLPGEEMMRSRDLRFSRRVFIYYEDDLTLQQRDQIDQLYRQNDIVVQLRGTDYMSSKKLGKKPIQ